MPNLKKYIFLTVEWGEAVRPCIHRCPVHYLSMYCIDNNDNNFITHAEFLKSVVPLINYSSLRSTGGHHFNTYVL